MTRPLLVTRPLEDIHFSDAELVAEYWHQHSRFQLRTEGYYSDDEGYVFDTEEREKHILDTFFRFATYQRDCT